MRSLLTTLFMLTILYASAKENEHLSFIENKGQITDQYFQSRSDIDFKISGQGINVFIGSGHMHYQWHRYTTPNTLIKGRVVSLSTEPATIYRMDVELIGANGNAPVITEEKQGDYEQYYTGNTGMNGILAHSYKKITYQNIYPGIDWVLYMKDNSLKHEFVVKAGADPSVIKIKYRGATSMQIDPGGSLTTNTPMGSLSEDKPFSYQRDGKVIPSAYILRDGIISFDIGTYSGELVIDPTLVWGTYYGDINQDLAYDVAVDANGDIYFCGYTTSLNNIATIGSHQSVYAGGAHEAYLAKFDNAGNRIWATYYGGVENDLGYSIACDPMGNVFLSGTTSSTAGIVTPGAHQTALASATNAFLVKFNSDGTRIWGTYYGGDSESPSGQPIACDDSGNVFLAGATSSTYNIATPGGFQENTSSSFPFYIPDGYLVKFDSNGVRQWGTYYGDTGHDWINGLCTDHDGNVYITGETESVNSIATPGSHQDITGGMGDGFTAKFNAAGERIWGTYYGGTAIDKHMAIAYSDGHIYTVGVTASTNDISTINSYQPALAGVRDLFVVKMDTSGERQWATYFGGPAFDAYSLVGRMISCDNAGNSYITGLTGSTTGIVLPGAHQHIFGGGAQDAFLAKIDPSGSPEWSTYYGGCGNEVNAVCAADNNGGVYLSGGTASSNEITTPGSFMPVFAPVTRAFLARFNDIPKPLDTIAGDTSLCDGDIATFTASPVFGATSYTWILPNGWTGSSTTNTITTTVTVPGGDIMVVANKACVADTLPLLHVDVHPLPQPVITQNVFTLSTDTYVGYQWYYNTTNIPGATNQTHTATLDGDYYVVVTDTNGCSDTSNTIVITNVGLDDPEYLSEEVRVYPNPTNNIINVTLDKGFANDGVITIYDVVGKEISRRDITGATNYSFNLSGMASGLYFIHVSATKGTSVQKFELIK